MKQREVVQHTKEEKQGACIAHLTVTALIFVSNFVCQEGMLKNLVGNCLSSVPPKVDANWFINFIKEDFQGNFASDPMFN